MNKLMGFYNLFRKGSVIANPTAWKNGQITGSILAGILATVVALAKVYGYELPLSDDQLLSIGSGIVAIVGLFINPALTTATSSKVGLPASDEAPRAPSPLTGY